MVLSKKISLLTLLGLILPFGNIWGPFIIKVPKGSKESDFRHLLIAFQTILTVISFAISIGLIAEAIYSEYNISQIKMAAYIFLIQDIVIIAVAVITALLAKSEC